MKLRKDRRSWRITRLNLMVTDGDDFLMYRRTEASAFCDVQTDGGRQAPSFLLLST